jgi:hypothetical protein
MHRVAYFFPVSYLIYSRIKTIKEWLSWFYLFPLFCLFSYGYYFAPACAPSSFVVSFVVIFLAVMALYEIGYIYNDIRAVKIESAPTLRVKSEWFAQNLYLLVGYRLVFIFGSIFFLYINSKQLCVSGSVLNFIISLSCLGAAFYLHNVVRGPANILTFCVLSFLKYYAVLFLVKDILFFVVVFISFTLIRTLEYSSLKGYIKGAFEDFVVSDIDRFRAVYYGLVFIVFSTFAFFGVAPWNYLPIVVYFFVYRLTIYFLVSKRVVG